MTKKLYIARLEFAQWLDNIYLEGDATDQAADDFANAMEQVVAARETTADWLDYRRKSLAIFCDSGFMQVGK